MKFIIYYRYCFYVNVLLGFVMVSCTEDYYNINMDKNTIAAIGPEHLGFLFNSAVSRPIIYEQTFENLFSQQYAQYVANNATYFPTDRYTINMGWARASFNTIYNNGMPQLQAIMEMTEEDSAEYAIANIWWVYLFQMITDQWGPIPYFEAGKRDDFVPYDSEESIYLDFIDRLEIAVRTLLSHSDVLAFGGASDVIYNGEVDKWIKFGNSLLLRCAMRISRIAPDVAQPAAELAVANGVMDSSPNDDAFRERNQISYNYLSQMSEWFEFNMSAAMKSIMVGYNDPRIVEYWLPAETSNTFEGLRNGLSIEQLSLSENGAKANSHIGPRWSNASRGGVSNPFLTPDMLMCSAESYFLRAEGSLLGWNMGGDPKDLYESGIRNSMIQWGIDNEELIKNYIDSDDLPIPPGDYLNSPAAAEVPVRFDPGDVNVQKTQIALQKWLAVFPDGTEGWAEYRRNHDLLPLYPVANSDNPDIPDPTQQWIRRLPFLTYEYETNLEGVEEGLKVLNGEDKITTPLWWDVH